VWANMYSDPFSSTTPAAAGIDNPGPGCVKWRETLPSQEESAGRDFPMGQLVTKILVSLESPLPPCPHWPGLKSPVPRHWEPGPDRCPHHRVDFGWMVIVRTPWTKYWLCLVRTNPIPVNLLRDWKRGCFRCGARGVFAGKRRRTEEIFFLNMWLMIAFITCKSNLVPLLEGLYNSNPCRFESSGVLIAVVRSHTFYFYVTEYNVGPDPVSLFFQFFFVSFFFTCAREVMLWYRRNISGEIHNQGWQGWFNYTCWIFLWRVDGGSLSFFLSLAT